MSARNRYPSPLSASSGRVGSSLVTGACFAELGHPVVLRDVDPERIAPLRQGRLPIYEPGLSDLFERNWDRVRFTTDIEELFEATGIAFVCVGTPDVLG